MEQGPILDARQADQLSGGDQGHGHLHPVGQFLDEDLRARCEPVLTGEKLGPLSPRGHLDEVASVPELQRGLLSVDCFKVVDGGCVPRGVGHHHEPHRVVLLVGQELLELQPVDELDQLLVRPRVEQGQDPVRARKVRRHAAERLKVTVPLGDP